MSSLTEGDHQALIDLQDALIRSKYILSGPGSDAALIGAIVRLQEIVRRTLRLKPPYAPPAMREDDV